jgi:hydroxyacylglutathione hydrolase
VNPIPIHAHNPGPMTGAGNHTWWLPGRVPTLVDAGTGDPRHLDELERASGGRGAPLQVLITHAHSDHMSGAPAIADRWPGARFAKVPWPDRDGRYPVPCAPLADGQVVAAGDGGLHVLHTPGHSPDHVCLWDPERALLFCGDLMIEGRTVVVPASRGGRLRDYLHSLERVIALGPSRAFPAHGPVIGHPVERARTYLRHRAKREAQVAAALSAGAGTPAEIAGRIYENLPDELKGVAEESVLAHLVKLEDDGRARRVVADDDAAPAFEAVESAAE